MMDRPTFTFALKTFCLCILSPPDEYITCSVNVLSDGLNVTTFDEKKHSIPVENAAELTLMKAYFGSDDVRVYSRGMKYSNGCSALKLVVNSPYASNSAFLAVCVTSNSSQKVKLQSLWLYCTYSHHILLNGWTSTYIQVHTCTAINCLYTFPLGAHCGICRGQPLLYSTAIGFTKIICYLFYYTIVISENQYF